MEEDEIRSIPIDSLELPIRALNCFQSAGAASVGGIIDLFDDPIRLASMRGFGRKSFNDVCRVLSTVGVCVIGDPLRDGRELIRKAKKPARELGFSVYLTESQISDLIGLKMDAGQDDDEITGKLRIARMRAC